VGKEEGGEGKGREREAERKRRGVMEGSEGKRSPPIILA